MSVHIDSRQIHVLADEFDHIPNRATHLVANAVEDTAKEGNRIAQAFATVSAGRHGKWYPKTITPESSGFMGLSWIYGPVSGRPQGGMSFEYGSRNQPPHLDLAKSADIIGPRLSKRVGDAIGRTFDE